MLLERPFRRIARSSTFGYVWSCGIVGLTTALLFVVQHTVGLQVANISLGYIVAVLLAAISAGRHGPGPRHLQILGRSARWAHLDRAAPWWRCDLPLYVAAGLSRAAARYRSEEHT